MQAPPVRRRPRATRAHGDFGVRHLRRARASAHRGRRVRSTRHCHCFRSTCRTEGQQALLLRARDSRLPAHSGQGHGRCPTRAAKLFLWLVCQVAIRRSPARESRIGFGPPPKYCHEGYLNLTQLMRESRSPELSCKLILIVVVWVGFRCVTRGVISWCCSSQPRTVHRRRTAPRNPFMTDLHWTGRQTAAALRLESVDEAGAINRAAT